MEDGRRIQHERRVQLFGKVEPVLEDLYRQLCMEENKDDAEVILVALARVRAELAAGRQGLGATSMLCEPAARAGHTLFGLGTEQDQRTDRKTGLQAMGLSMREGGLPFC